MNYVGSDAPGGAFESADGVSAAFLRIAKGRRSCLFPAVFSGRESSGNGINIQKWSLCKRLSVWRAVENFFHRNPGIVEKYPCGLRSGGKGVWKTLWKMFITLCTGNYPFPYVNRNLKSAGKTPVPQAGEKGLKHA